MRHVIPPYHVRDNIDDDFFGRADFTENLLRLFSKTENSLVLTINASWGEGKTTFIKLMERELRKREEFIPIYYDAFQNDFSSDAFISLAVTIQKALKKQSGGNRRGIKDYKDASINLSLVLAKMTSNVALKVTTGGVLDADSFWDWVNGSYKRRKVDNEKAATRGSKELIGDKYDAFFSKEELIQEYQKKLKLLLSWNTNDHKKIVLFIDELDRCRPSYAIEVLEKIKHLFSIENVIFVLAINREQLVKVIVNAYGVDEQDASVYLQKFVHVETILPKMLSVINKDNFQLFIQNLKNHFEIPDHYLNPQKFAELIANMSRLQFTPRSMERIFTLFVISLDSCSENKRQRLAKEIAFLSILKIKSPDQYEKIKKEGRISSNTHGINPTHLGNRLIPYLAKGTYFEQNKIEKKQQDSIWISSIPEAAKIVDIYDLPKEEEMSNGYSEKISQSDSDFQQQPK